MGDLPNDLGRVAEKDFRDNEEPSGIIEQS
jgi:hypothetical protein